jgi:hypothetical protein
VFPADVLSAHLVATRSAVGCRERALFSIYCG